MDELQLSLFFPCYNDAGTIASMVALADRTACDLVGEGEYEIIVVDDGSRDHSRAILSELEPKYEALRLIFHDANRGYGGALRSGFAASRGQWVFYTDGDYQYDVSELRALWGLASESVDVVNGFKIKRHDPWYRVAIGLTYQHLMKFVFGLVIRDVDCDFRIIRRKIMSRFSLEFDSGVICIELIRKLQDAGARFAEVGVSHMFRAYGHSQFFNVPRLLRVFRHLAMLWWRLRNASREPSRPPADDKPRPPSDGKTP